jgi:hypothetical protein
MCFPIVRFARRESLELLSQTLFSALAIERFPRFPAPVPVLVVEHPGLGVAHVGQALRAAPHPGPAQVAQ